MTGGPYWTRSWNPIVGCTGCEVGEACWAIGMARRQMYAAQVLTLDRKHWNGTSLVFPERMEEPLKWRQPQVVATCFMGDIAHADAETIRRVFGVALVCEEHEFLFLTKWPSLLLEKLRTGKTKTGITSVAAQQVALTAALEGDPEFAEFLGHLWLGVSATDQATYNERWSVLCEQWDGSRWLSLEPCLSAIEIGGFGMPDWVIAGSSDTVGHGAAAFTLETARSIVAQCEVAGVPAWIKQAAWNHEPGHYSEGRVIEAPFLDGCRWREAPPAIAAILQREGKTP